MIGWIISAAMMIMLFPAWMILVCFRLGDKIAKDTGNKDAGAVAAVSLTVLPIVMLVVAGAVLAMVSMP